MEAQDLVAHPPHGVQGVEEPLWGHPSVLLQLPSVPLPCACVVVWWEGPLQPPAPAAPRVSVLTGWKPPSQEWGQQHPWLGQLGHLQGAKGGVSQVEVC